MWLLPLKGNQKLIAEITHFRIFSARKCTFWDCHLYCWNHSCEFGCVGKAEVKAVNEFGQAMPGGVIWGWFGLLRFSPSDFFFSFFVEFWNLHVQLDQGEGVTGWMIFDQTDKNNHFCSEIRFYKEVWTSSLLSHHQVKWTTFWDHEMGGLLWFGLQDFFAQLSKLNWQDLTNISVGSTPHPYQWKMEVLVGIPS